MWRFPLLAFLSALSVALPIKYFLLQPFLSLPENIFFLNSILAPVLLLLVSIIYGLTFRMADFPGLLLVVMVVRLLICLTYVLIISFLEKPLFKNMALQFFIDFVIYTATDIWLANKFLKNREA